MAAQGVCVRQLLAQSTCSLKEINIRLSIFDQIPELETFSEVRFLVSKEGRELADFILRAVYQLEDPRSVLYRMPMAERQYEVVHNFIDGKFNLDKYKGIRDGWGRWVLTKEQNLFKIVMDKIDEMTAFLKELDFTDDDQFKKAMIILEKLEKIWKSMENIKQKMVEMDLKTNMRGGAKESRRESRRNR